MGRLEWYKDQNEQGQLCSLRKISKEKTRIHTLVESCFSQINSLSVSLNENDGIYFDIVCLMPKIFVLQKIALTTFVFVYKF